MDGFPGPCPKSLALGGSPTIFLDIRERERISLASDSFSRKDLIEAAKKSMIEVSGSLNTVSSGLFDSLDVCAVSYLHDVLFGDGNVDTTEAHLMILTGDRQRMPLCEAIKHAESGRKDKAATGLQPATPQEVASLCDWYAHEFFKRQFEQLKRPLPGETQENLCKTYADHFQEKMECLSI